MRSNRAPIRQLTIDLLTIELLIIAMICFQNVSKRFVFENSAATSLLSSLLSFRRPEKEVLWAVKDVSFEIGAGESVALIGHNGSGKSTLLKLATRILRPTSGSVQMNGRVSALLELGAGFHDDLTGRENIYLNGSVLGLSKREIDTEFDAILDFSELHNFIDVPVKHYSSGMYMRLGFSVAVHCRPDILLVDEILSVGDRAFQRKCLDHIFQMKRRGVTIVLVSHHLDTVQKLCDRVVWMDHGQMIAEGGTTAVLNKYVQQSNVKIGEQRVAQGLGTFDRNGTYEAEITAVRFLNNQGEEQKIFHTGDEMVIELAYTAHEPIRQPEIGFSIFRDDDLQISGTNNRVTGFDIPVIDGDGVLRYRIERLSLLPGTYEVSAAIQDDLLPQAYDFHVRAYSFRVQAGHTNESQGVVALPARWEWQPET